VTEQPPFERIPGGRTHGPRWSETALAEVVAVGTGQHNGQVRIKLYAYDGAEGQGAELWARVAVPVAGRERGAFLIPSKGDEVLVTFVGGDSRLPVVLGSLWNGRDAAPESLSNADAVETWSFTSPSGTSVTVRETSGADSTVTIDIPNKASATFSAEGTGKIELRAGGSTMAMDAQGIRFDTSGEFCATSATACHSASMVEFDAPLSSFSGVTQCTTSQADTVVGSVYTPGAGNIW
jgi:uncharacterized protein involved in type VI secretion and phage assembly